MALNPMRIKLKNGNALGDIVCMTCAVRDMAAERHCVNCGFECHWPKVAMEKSVECPLCERDSLQRKYKVAVETTYPLAWQNNPYLEESDEYDMELQIGPKSGVQHSNHSGLHHCESYRIGIEEKTHRGITIQQGELIPDLHLSEYEKQNPLIDGRYWLICMGMRPQFTSKLWPYDRWQQVVNRLQHITFVQIGSSEHYHPPLQGSNVINYIGKTEDKDTGIRDLFRLFYHCDGSAGLVSMHAHIAAAFKKPAVVVAGAREPMRFEAYPFHRYLANQGSMDCLGKVANGDEKHYKGIYSCWRTSIEACPNRDGEYAKCLTMITVDDVVNAIESYYIGGMLKPVQEIAKLKPKSNKVFKMVCNAHGFGGGERSAIWIMNRMLEDGYQVQLIPSKGICETFKKALSPYVQINSHLTAPCDILMLYANDMVFGFKDKYVMLKDVQAEKKIMVLNYRGGDAGKLDWTKTWDSYGFLCSDMRDGFLERVPYAANTFVLPPPVDLTEFLETDLGSLNKTLHIVRVSSQGDSKYPQDIGDMIDHIKKANSGTHFTFMPGPSFLPASKGLSLYGENTQPVLDVLRKGTVFWYILPDKFIDNGPRVIMEAMAAGLPVIADNRGGAKDRITEETGWLCDTQDEHIEVIKSLNGKILNEKGKAAKERARTEFNPEKWIEAIVG